MKTTIFDLVEAAKKKIDKCRQSILPENTITGMILESLSMIFYTKLAF
jgi:hypothetical protein